MSAGFTGNITVSHLLFNAFLEAINLALTEPVAEIIELISSNARKGQDRLYVGQGMLFLEVVDIQFQDSAVIKGQVVIICIRGVLPGQFRTPLPHRVDVFELQIGYNALYHTPHNFSSMELLTQPVRMLQLHENLSIH